MGHVQDRWTRPGPAGRRLRTERWGRGRRWQAVWIDPAGAERSRACRTREEAEAVWQAMEATVRRGDYVDPRLAQATTVGDVAAKWLAAKASKKATTVVSYESLWRTRVEPAWGTVALARVQHSDVAGWVAQLSNGGLSASRVRKAHVVLAGVLDLAVKDRLLATNPALGVDLPRLPRLEQRFLSHAEVDALVAAARTAGGPVGAASVAVLAYGGLRMGELFGLQVGDLDADRRRLWVRRELLEVSGRPQLDTPKNHQVRQVPVARELAEDLRRLIAGRDAGEPLLAAPEGGVWWRRNWRARVWVPATRAAGLAPLKPHELRHTSASLAIAAGADVKVVQRMLGHASAAMTLDLYGHLFDDRLNAVADAVAAAAARSRSEEAVTDQGRTKAAGNVIDLASRRVWKAT